MRPPRGRGCGCGAGLTRRAVVIQNTTFGGVQGFTRRPATAWFDAQGKFAGRIHQERNLTYALFVGAGHLVPQSKPVAVSTPVH